MKTISGISTQRMLDGPLRDALMWLLNLVRDFPRRFGRLTGAIISLPPEDSPTGYLFWLHSLSWYLFDLIGGPEFVQFFLRLATNTRPLTDDEVQAAVEVLGPRAIRFRDVRIARQGILQYVFRMNKNRAFATWHTINMPDGRENNIALLVHELTHTLQFERVGSVYIGQGLWAQARMGRKAYDYGGPQGLLNNWAAGKRVKDYNREQQGQITQDYCSLIRAGRDTSAYEPFIGEIRRGIV